MTELKDNQLAITLEDGNEVLFNILFTYHSDDFGKDYVFFYEAGDEEEDEIEISFASYIEKEGCIGELNDIESEEEYNMLCDVFNSYMGEDEEECDCSCDCDEQCDCDEDCGCCCGNK